jgi:hypothetical protein
MDKTGIGCATPPWRRWVIVFSHTEGHGRLWQVGVAACAVAESAPQWRIWDLKRGDLAKTGQSCSWQRWPWMEAVTAVWRSARLHGPGWSESHQASSLALEASAPLASKCTASTRGRRSFPLSQHASISARRVSSALFLLPIHSPPSAPASSSPSDFGR